MSLSPSSSFSSRGLCLLVAAVRHLLNVSISGWAFCSTTTRTGRAMRVCLFEMFYDRPDSRRRRTGHLRPKGSSSSMLMMMCLLLLQPVSLSDVLLLLLPFMETSCVCLQRRLNLIAPERANLDQKAANFVAFVPCLRSAPPALFLMALNPPALRRRKPPPIN